MSSREERIAKNESITRDINEGIERGHDGASRTAHVRMLCECGQDECDRVIDISIAEYEGLRDDPREFAVVRDHVQRDVERVVAENDRFTVVQKIGDAGEEAEEEDPRD